MGYDMYIVDPPEGDGYFRLNIWGMGVCRALMYERGMCFEAPFPSWPTPEQFGFADYEEAESELDDDFGEPTTDRGRAYRKAGDEARDGMVPDCPGIPIYKLGSNDGWLVTPIECTGALTRLKVWTAENGEALPTSTDDNGEYEVEWWPEWLAYLALAAAHGGFRVY